MVWPSTLAIGSVITIQLANGDRLKGTVLGVDGDWLLFDTGPGRLAILRQHIACLGIDGPLPPKGRSGGSVKASATASNGDGDSPDPAVLRAVVDGFLDDRVDDDLAQAHGLPRSLVRSLRRAFECARGNLVEDQLPPAARAHVEALRSALAS